MLKYLDFFSTELYYMNSYLNKNITASYKDYTSAINNVHDSTAEEMIRSTNSFTKDVIKNSQLYPCCNKYANMAFENLHNASNGLSMCAKQLFDGRVALYKNHTKAIIDFHMAYNYYTNMYDRCITVNCNSWTCLTSHLKYLIYWTPIAKCANAVC
jgi:Special lobe-specific silk protein SSP160